MKLPVITIWVVLLFPVCCYAQHPLADLALPVVHPQKDALSLQTLQGKVVILVFWATWCRASTEGMDRLSELQKQLGHALQIIAVSAEPAEKQLRFIRRNPYAFLYAVDSARRLSNRFPYRVLPHVVILDTQGNTVVITEPRFIKEQVVMDVLQGKNTAIPAKVDPVRASPAAYVYYTDTSIAKESFMIQPALQGVGTAAQIPFKGQFAGRRICLRNFTAPDLYAIAFRQAIPVICEIDNPYNPMPEAPDRYCVDLILPTRGDMLYNTFMHELNTAFHADTSRQRRMVEVCVLYCTEDICPLLSAPNQSCITMNDTGFESAGATLDDFADYLQTFGAIPLPVVNETNLAGTYAIQCQVRTGDKRGLAKALKKLGLAIRTEKREREVLVVSAR